MEDHSRFLNRLRKKALGMNDHAHAEEPSMDPRQHNTGDAQGENSDASNASEKQRGSEGDTHAGLDAVQKCSVCNENLRRLPERITQGGFRHSTIPVHICSLCDGPALELASRQFDE